MKKAARIHAMMAYLEKRIDDYAADNFSHAAQQDVVPMVIALANLYALQQRSVAMQRAEKE